MKEYTAIYSSETIKNIQYSFRAEDLPQALDFCEHKFSTFPAVIIVENFADSKANEGLVVWANGHEVK